MKLTPTCRLMARVATEMKPRQLGKLLNLSTFPAGVKGTASTPIKFITLLRQNCESVGEFIRTLREMLETQTSFIDLLKVVRVVGDECEDTDLDIHGVEFPMGSVEHKPPPKQKTTFNATLLKISDAITDEVLEIMVTLTPIPHSKKERITVGHSLFNEMKQYGCISENDTEFLVDLMVELKLVKCLEMLEEYKRHYPPIQYPPFTPQRPISLGGHQATPYSSLPAQPAHSGRREQVHFRSFPEQGGTSKHSVVIGNNGYTHSLHGEGAGGTPGFNSTSSGNHSGSNPASGPSSNPVGGPSSNPAGGPSSNPAGGPIPATTPQYSQEASHEASPGTGYRAGPGVSVANSPSMMPIPFNKSLSVPSIPSPSPPPRPRNGTRQYGFNTQGLPPEAEAEPSRLETVSGSDELPPSAPPQDLVQQQSPSSESTPHTPSQASVASSGGRRTSQATTSALQSRQSGGAVGGSRKSSRLSSQKRPLTLSTGRHHSPAHFQSPGGVAPGRLYNPAHSQSPPGGAIPGASARSSEDSLESYSSPHMHSNVSSHPTLASSNPSSYQPPSNPSFSQPPSNPSLGSGGNSFFQPPSNPSLSSGGNSFSQPPSNPSLGSGGNSFSQPPSQSSTGAGGVSVGRSGDPSLQSPAYHVPNSIGAGNLAIGLSNDPSLQSPSYSASPSVVSTGEASLSSFSGRGDSVFQPAVSATGGPRTHRPAIEIANGFATNVEQRPSSSIQRVLTSEYSSNVSCEPGALAGGGGEGGVQERGSMNRQISSEQQENYLNNLPPHALQGNHHAVVLNKQQAMQQAGVNEPFESINHPVTTSAQASAVNTAPLSQPEGESEESRHNSSSLSESGREVAQCSETSNSLYPPLPAEQANSSRKRKKRSSAGQNEESTKRPKTGWFSLSRVGNFLGWSKRKKSEASVEDSEQELATSSSIAEEQDDEAFHSCEEDEP